MNDSIEPQRIDLFRRAFFCAALLFSPLLHSLSAQDSDEDVFEISPFTVRGSEDSGYRATTTLAGTRLKTELRDIGSAISVLTEEFFKDTGATDGATSLSYALNMEVAGTNGNFSSPSITDGRAGTAEGRSRPQNTQRVRGLSEASLTRGYFLTDIPFDGYNTSRVTINRGPNSLLFGIGDPGGIINNSVKQASTGSDFGEISVRFGERSSHRETIDFNKVLIEDRLAIRLSALNEDTRYKQRPAFELDQRIYGAFEAVLSKNEKSNVLGKTVLRGNFESGSIDGTPPNIIPPGNAMNAWFKAPSRSLEQYTRTTLPAWVDTWTPKRTFDTRQGFAYPSTPYSVRTPYYIQLPVVYNDLKAQTPTIGLSNPNVSGTLGRVLFQAVPGSTVNRFDLLSTEPFEAKVEMRGFAVPVFQDRKVLDNTNMLITGKTSRVEQDFDAQNLTFEQTLFEGKAGIELAYDTQSYELDSKQPFRHGRESDVWIDVSEYLSNYEPNPNVGRPFMVNRPTWMPYDYDLTERKAYRATAFVDLDFSHKEGKLSWLGRHVFTGFYNEQTIDTLKKESADYWIDTSSSTDVAGILNHPLSNFRRDVITQVYVGPDLRASRYGAVSDVRLTDYMRIPVPKNGDRYYTAYNGFRSNATLPVQDGAGNWSDPSSFADFEVYNALLRGSNNRQKIKSEALSWNSHLFDGNLVGVIGWRTDSADSFEHKGNANLPSGEWDPANLELKKVPDAVEKGSTLTKSLVAHFPEDLLFELPGNTDLSFHYSESENFSPQGIRRTAMGEILTAPTGQTKEYGFTVETLDRKLSMRFNWFKTNSQYASANQDTGRILQDSLYAPTYASNGWLFRWKEAQVEGIPLEDALRIEGGVDSNARFDSYEQVFAAIKSSLPVDLLSLLNPRFVSDDSDLILAESVQGLSATKDFKTKGFEFEAVGSLTDRWQISLNVAQQETVQSNTAPELNIVVNKIKELAQASGAWDLRESPALSLATTQTHGFYYDFYNVGPLAALAAKDGNVSLEQREWRANVISTYRFDENSALKGFGFGGALRWQSGVATGYETLVNADNLLIPDLDNPFMGPAELNGDIWFSYKRRLMDKYNWKIQLNVRNIIGDTDYIPVITNPDGTVAVVRNPNPREVFLTNTISF